MYIYNLSRCYYTRFHNYFLCFYLLKQRKAFILNLQTFFKFFLKKVTISRHLRNFPLQQSQR